MNLHPKTTKEVVRTIKKAVQIMKTLPPVQPQGYYSSLMRLQQNALNEFFEVALKNKTPENVPFPCRPSPTEIDAMWHVCFIWLHWLNVDDRRLVWHRCSGTSWKVLIDDMNLARSTAFRRFNDACQIILSKVQQQEKNLKTA